MNTEEKNKIANSAYLKALDDVEKKINHAWKNELWQENQIVKYIREVILKELRG